MGFLNLFGKSDEDLLIERLQNGGSLDAMDEESAGYGDSYYRAGNGLTLGQQASGLNDPSLGSSGFSLSLANIGSGLKNFFGTTLGVGDNATTLGQLGLNLGLGLYGINQQKKANNAKIAILRDQLNSANALNRANFVAGATDYGNKALQQAVNQYYFHQNAGGEAASQIANANLAALNQLNTAANSLGANNALNPQINQLKPLTA